jgi:hypothetical protein
LCTYPLATSQPADILEVWSAHQFAIARRKGDWEFINIVKPQTLTHSLTPRMLEVLARREPSMNMSRRSFESSAQ